MFFRSLPGSIARGLSTNQVCKVGAMAKGNYPDTNRETLYLLPGYVNQRETKLFEELSRDVNKEELEGKESPTHFAMAQCHFAVAI